MVWGTVNNAACKRFICELYFPLDIPVIISGQWNIAHDLKRVGENKSRVIYVQTDLSRNVGKRTLRHVRPGKIQINLRICAVWWKISLSASLIDKDTVSSCGQRRLIRLRECVSWFESSLDACPKVHLPKFRFVYLEPPCRYSRTLMARTSFGHWNFVVARDSSSHWGLIIAQGQDAHGVNLGMSFRSSTK